MANNNVRQTSCRDRTCPRWFVFKPGYAKIRVVEYNTARCMDGRMQKSPGCKTAIARFQADRTFKRETHG